MATGADRQSPPVRGAAARAPYRPGAPPPAGLDALDAHTISLVQASWARVMPISDAAATLFYDRLFGLDPTLKTLFKNDMREQKKKLMQTLAVAVDGLRSVPRLVPVLEDLGARHAGYMVQDHHYELVGQALLWTLREGLGDDFTTEVEAAWTRVYVLVANVMRNAGAAHGVDPGEQTVPTDIGYEPPGSAAARSGVIPAARSRVLPAAVYEEEWPSLELSPEQGRVAFAPDVRPPDARTIELVQASWTRVAPMADAAATLFYDRLFSLAPSVKPLFKSDMREQKKKLMQTLGTAVDGLRTPARLVPVLQQLGARHAGYMVQDHHYALVGEALLWTLHEALGDELTPELESAWRQVYGFVAGIMRRAAQPGGMAQPAGTAQPRPAVAGDARVPGPLPAAGSPGPAGMPAQVSDAHARATPDANLVIPVSTQDRVVDVRVSFATPAMPVAAAAPAPAAVPAAAHASMSLATAVLLAATCGTLVVLAATAALFGLSTLAGVTVMSDAGSYAAPAVLMTTSVAVFLLGYAWGRRSRARKDPERSR
jgi:hemoglobin-like flavoprotein